MHAALAADGINRDDIGVVELGRRQGLGLEPPELGRVHGCRERQHLERHPAVQRTLHRLVDHPHAPPAHLGDQAEVAQVADPGVDFTRFARLLIGDQRRRNQRRLADEFKARQARLQVLGQLGMLGQERLPRGRRAFLGGGQVGIQHLDQPDFAGRFGLTLESLLVLNISLVRCPLSVVGCRCPWSVVVRQFFVVTAKFSALANVGTFAIPSTDH